MIRKIKLFWELPTRAKMLFIEAWFLLGLMKVLIKTVSFKRLTRSLRQSSTDVELSTLNDDQAAVAVQVSEIIGRAANNTPWESACLVQSLTAHRMLKKRGIPGVFYLGVMKDKGNDKDVRGHAWSQCDETIITGAKGHEDYTVVSVYRW